MRYSVRESKIAPEKPVACELHASNSSREAKRLASHKTDCLYRRVSANATDSAKSGWELRLLPTPLYEYLLPDDGVEYGSVLEDGKPHYWDFLKQLRNQISNPEERGISFQFGGVARSSISDQSTTSGKCGPVNLLEQSHDLRPTRLVFLSDIMNSPGQMCAKIYVLLGVG